MKKVGRDQYAWSRFSIDESGKRMLLPFNTKSSLSEIVGILAYHKFGEKPEEQAEASEETRVDIKRSLRPWEDKK